MKTHTDSANMDKDSATIEEGVLKDVLEQLEKERLRRAELEAQLAKIRKQEKSEKSKKNNSGKDTNSHCNTVTGTITITHSDELSKDGSIHTTSSSPTPSIASSEGSSHPHPPQSLSLSDSQAELEGKQFLDDADRIHKINKFVTKFIALDDSQKRSKRVVSSLLSCLYKDIQTSVLGEGTKFEQKVREQRVKDYVNKVLALYSKNASNRLWAPGYDDAILRPILETNTLQFVKFLTDIRVYKEKKKLEEQLKNTKNNPSSLATDSGAQSSSSPLSEQHKEADDSTRREIITLKTERDGFLDLINALTSDNNAMTLSSNNKRGTLPLDIVRFLEIMPWDETSKQHTTASEEVHQWQVYDSKTKQWVDKIRQFPPSFSSLPVSKLEKLPGQVSHKDDSLLFEESISVSSPVREKIQHVFETMSLDVDARLLLTDSSCTKVLDLTSGYPLPERGTWEWIGRWSIDGVSAFGDDHDEGGWNYSEKPEFLVSMKEDRCFPSAFDDAVNSDSGEENSEPTTPLRKYRRRIWKRRRQLLSYPGISQRTKQLLGFYAHEAKLNLTVTKLHDQVHKMQDRLMHTEVEMDKRSAEIKKEYSKLEEEVKEKSKLIAILQNKRKSTSSWDAGVKSIKKEIYSNQASFNQAVQARDFIGPPIRLAAVNTFTISSPSKEERDESVEDSKEGESSSKPSSPDKEEGENDNPAPIKISHPMQQSKSPNKVSMDSMIWKNISSKKGALLETVKSNVDTVKSNVQSAKNNMHLISEKALSLQNLANQVHKV